MCSELRCQPLHFRLDYTLRLDLSCLKTVGSNTSLRNLTCLRRRLLLGRIGKRSLLILREDVVNGLGVQRHWVMSFHLEAVVVVVGLLCRRVVSHFDK